MLVTAASADPDPEPEGEASSSTAALPRRSAKKTRSAATTTGEREVRDNQLPPPLPVEACLQIVASDRAHALDADPTAAGRDSLPPWGRTDASAPR